MGIKCVIRRIKGKIKGNKDIPLHLYAVILETEKLTIEKCLCCNHVHVRLKEEEKID